MGTKVPVFVPFRTDNGQRALNWALIKETVWDEASWAEVVLGESPDGPFNLSAARNDAASKMDWDVAIFADADSFVPLDILDAAAAVALETKQIVLPHSRWVNVGYDERFQFMTDKYVHYDPKRTVVSGTKSSVLVIPRQAYDAVNGFDERFQGWGWEDTAFHLAVTNLYSPVIQFEGNVWHLEHERPNGDINRGTDENSIRNRAHYKRYQSARNNTELRSLINGNRVTL